MSRAYLVRHVSVEPTVGVPPDEWRPTAAGLEAARRLAAAPAWRTAALVASSPEPKAVATAEPIAAAAGIRLRVEHDLREVARPPVAALDGRAHADRVRRYLAGEAVGGWEPRPEAERRFAHCVDELVHATEGPLVVVSHATVLALYLRLTAHEWASIALPAVAVADTETRALLEPFRDVDDFRAGSRG